jgi:hypothetical protein
MTAEWVALVYLVLKRLMTSCSRLLASGHRFGVCGEFPHSMLLSLHRLLFRYHNTVTFVDSWILGQFSNYLGFWIFGSFSFGDCQHRADITLF